jgi:hypothetical protein
MDME